MGNYKTKMYEEQNFALYWSWKALVTYKTLYSLGTTLTPGNPNSVKRVFYCLMILCELGIASLHHVTTMPARTLAVAAPLHHAVRKNAAHCTK